jgi:Tfp pilus assembly major pilin PilA
MPSMLLTSLGVAGVLAILSALTLPSVRATPARYFRLAELALFGI